MAITLVALLIGYFVRIDYMWSFLLILFTWGIRQLFAQFARGIGKVKIFAASGVLQALSLCLFNIVFLTLLHQGVNGYLLSITLSNLVSPFSGRCGKNTTLYPSGRKGYKSTESDVAFLHSHDSQYPVLVVCQHFGAVYPRVVLRSWGSWVVYGGEQTTVSGASDVHYIPTGMAVCFVQRDGK